MKIRSIFIQYKWRFALIFSLLLIESIIVLFIPLFIGYSIDGAIEGEYSGTYKLGILGLLIIFIGGGRRFFDSRFYAKLYRNLGSKMFSIVDENQVSVKSARLGMINEIIEFLENSLPALFSTIISVLGVMFIIATLNFKVFIAGIITTLMVYLIYFLTKGRTTYLNKSYNNEIENQVDTITNNNKEEFKIHLKNLMKWNIKLSDLEVFNFSLSWIILMSFLVLSIILSIDASNIAYGALFSLIMYVFQYIESVIALPLFYQNWLRLEEIKNRLEAL